jgi:hypothetical protein
MRVAQTTATDFFLVGIDAVAHNYSIVHGDEAEEIEPTHASLKAELIEHFCYKFRRNEIKNNVVINLHAYGLMVQYT